MREKMTDFIRNISCN